MIPETPGGNGKIRWKRREGIKAVLLSRSLLGSAGGPQRETAPLSGEGARVFTLIACPSLIEDGSWGVNSLASVHSEQPERALRERPDWFLA